MLSNNHVRASQRQLGEVYSRVTFFVSPHLASIVVLGVLAAGCSISPTAVTNDPATSAVQATTLSTIRNAFSATDSEWPAKRERLVCDAHRVLAALDSFRARSSTRFHMTTSARGIPRYIVLWQKR
jgi:hypothetical protein